MSGGKNHWAVEETLRDIAWWNKNVTCKGVPVCFLLLLICYNWKLQRWLFGFCIYNFCPIFDSRFTCFLKFKRKKCISLFQCKWHFSDIFSPFRIAVVCAILHNVCKLRNVPLPDGDRVEEEEQGDVADAPHVGLRYRDHFANTYF